MVSQTAGWLILILVNCTSSGYYLPSSPVLGTPANQLTPTPPLIQNGNPNLYLSPYTQFLFRVHNFSYKKPGNRRQWHFHITDNPTEERDSFNVFNGQKNPTERVGEFLQNDDPPFQKPTKRFLGVDLPDYIAVSGNTNFHIKSRLKQLRQKMREFGR